MPPRQILRRGTREPDRRLALAAPSVFSHERLPRTPVPQSPGAANFTNELPNCASEPGRPHWPNGTIEPGRRDRRRMRDEPERWCAAKRTIDFDPCATDCEPARSNPGRPATTGDKSNPSGGTGKTARTNPPAAIVAEHRARTLAIARPLAASGRLAPPDTHFAEALAQRLAAAGSPPPGTQTATARPTRSIATRPPGHHTPPEPARPRFARALSRRGPWSTIPTLA